MTRPPDVLDQDETGLTLVELLIYSFLTLGLLVLVGSLLTTGFRAEQQARSLAEAASLGQLVSRSVEEGVRNASNILADPEDANGQLLRARVAVGSSDGQVEWECQAWYYAPSTSSFYWATSDIAMIAAPTNLADLASAPWTLLGDGIDRADGVSAFFGAVPASAAGAERIVLRFKVSADAVDLVLIPNTVVKRLPASGGTGPSTCF